jgi:regulator of cell morphogenesis and NO signaling
MGQHGKKYPELSEISKTFEQLSEKLLIHNRHEETTTFPYLKHLDSAFRKGESYAQLFVRTLKKPFTNIREEHTEIGILLNKLKELTGNYHFGEEACTNHQVIYRKLQEFHNDLVQHKHLENNILFPRATEIERLLLLH